MTLQETRQKIQALLDSGQGENVYIGIYMLVNEFGMSISKALKELKPFYNSQNPDNFIASFRIANIWIEYEFEKGYVPYMGTEATVSRMVSQWNGTKQKFMEGFSTFLPIDDTTSLEEIKELIMEDYYSLIPNIIKWTFEF